MRRLSGVSLPPPWFRQLHAESPDASPFQVPQAVCGTLSPSTPDSFSPGAEELRLLRNRGESTWDPTELSQHHKVPSSIIFNEDLHFQEGIFLCDCSYDGGLYFDSAAIRAIIFAEFHLSKGFPHGSVVRNLPANAGDLGSIPRLGRSPGGGHGNPLQYSCLENPMDRGAWRTTIHGVAKSQTQLSDKAQHVAQYTSLLVL